MRLWRLLGHYDSETTAYTACAGALQTSPYTPDFSGTLVALRIIVMGGAATSLVQGIQFRLNSTTFTPNAIECAGQGSGLQTAPHHQTPPIDWSVNQPVRSGNPVHVEGRNNAGAETPVTVNAAVWGLFDVAQGR